jgi:Na+/proline symporter
MTWLVWLLYGTGLVLLARWERGRNVLLPGKVSVLVQALAYVATYVSAVALVGFAGLSHRMGLQMLVVAAGTVWLGTWFVYRFLAIPTRVWQRRLGASTPAELLSGAYGAPRFAPFIGILSAVLLVVYMSAVIKGAAVMVTGNLGVPITAPLWGILLLVVANVAWGGLRGVLFTEAFQGGIMLAGVVTLLVNLSRAIGGPLQGLRAMAALPATEAANRGFAALSSGEGGMLVLSLTLVTGVGIWAQPQMIQRHFALQGRESRDRAVYLAMLSMAVVVGGAFAAGAFSRLVLGPDAGHPDTVMPQLVMRLLPPLGRELFTLAILSASLSTASALLHIIAGSLGHDVMRRRLRGSTWLLTVTASAAASGLVALKSSQLIALVCATSWTLLASAILVPYVSLVLFSRGGITGGATSCWCSSLSGLFGSLAWYVTGYLPTSRELVGFGAPGILGNIHPFLFGLLFSTAGMLAGLLLERARKVTEATERGQGLERPL